MTISISKNTSIRKWYWKMTLLNSISRCENDPYIYRWGYWNIFVKLI